MILQDGPLDAAELTRYARQMALPEWGVAAQIRLKRARAIVCGVGGLGSPAALYLAAAGIGTLRIIDSDRVALDNLNRQILYGEADIGSDKTAAAAAKLRRLNSKVAVEPCQVRISADNAAELVAESDVIVDGLDNLAARYLLNRAAVDLRIPLVHGAVNGFEGRVLTVVPGQSACLRCMHGGEPPPAATVPVVGVTAAVIGAVQATEAVKVVLGMGDLLTDRLLVFDGLRLAWREFRLQVNPACDHCGSIRKQR